MIEQHESKILPQNYWKGEIENCKKEIDKLKPFEDAATKAMINLGMGGYEESKKITNELKERWEEIEYKFASKVDSLVEEGYVVLKTELMDAMMEIIKYRAKVLPVSVSLLKGKKKSEQFG